jgi:hypothetical protein
MPWGGVPDGAGVVEYHADQLTGVGGKKLSGSQHPATISCVTISAKAGGAAPCTMGPPCRATKREMSILAASALPNFCSGWGIEALNPCCCLLLRRPQSVSIKLKSLLIAHCVVFMYTEELPSTFFLIYQYIMRRARLRNDVFVLTGRRAWNAIKS